MAVRYERYGLQGDPFKIRPLNPLKDPNDAKWVTRLTKFRLDDIDKELDKGIKQNKPCFFLVSGKSGTGRTSISNYILTSYRERRGINKDRFVIPEIKKMHEYVENVFRTWIIRLRSEIKKNIISSADYLEFVDLVQNTQDNLLNAILSDILLEVSRALNNANPKAGFGVYLEDIPKLDFLESAMEIFQDSSTVCVMTVSESALLNTQKDLKDFFHEKLEEIGDKEVWDVIDKRWNGNKPNPFDKNGILKAFNQRLPIARVFILMSKILATKLDYHPDGDVWPNAKELGFDEALIVSQVQTHFLPEWR